MLELDQIGTQLKSSDLHLIPHKVEDGSDLTPKKQAPIHLDILQRLAVFFEERQEGVGLIDTALQVNRFKVVGSDSAQGIRDMERVIIRIVQLEVLQKWKPGPQDDMYGVHDFALPPEEWDGSGIEQ